VLRDRLPVREGDQIVAYSIDRLSIEEPLSKFGEVLKAKNYDEMKKTVRELYEARFNRTLWQIVYEFDRRGLRPPLSTSDRGTASRSLEFGSATTSCI
jgi:hypothetical protein